MQESRVLRAYWSGYLTSIPDPVSQFCFLYYVDVTCDMCGHLEVEIYKDWLTQFYYISKY